MLFRKLDRSTIIFILITLFWATVPPSVTWAQADPLDIVIVIDNSGSMAQADAAAMRYRAARMLIDLLGDKDRVGIVTFEDGATRVTEVLQLIETAEEREEIKATVQAARHDDGGTNYARGLEEAYELLKMDRGNQRAVIFLTDGEPTVAQDEIDKEIDKFHAADIPIYLMLLNTTGIHSVNEKFAQTGPAPITISSATDIGRAFAYVLTDLRPTTYLDSLEQFPGDAQKTRFQAVAGEGQQIFGVTFVFLPTERNVTLNVQVVEDADNAQLLAGPDSNDYAVYSYRSNNALPLSGNWAFDVNTDLVTAFAFIRSDIQLALTIPPASGGFQRATPQNSPLLIGVSTIGGSVDNANIAVRLTAESSCFPTSGLEHTGESFDLQQFGLSENGSTFWQLIDTSFAAAFTVSVELRQLDQPLRLSRCFLFNSIESLDDAIVVERPTGLDRIENGVLPLSVQLASGLDWLSASAFIADPRGRVYEVQLSEDSDRGVWRGGFSSITEAGPYTIRFLATGLVEKQHIISVLGETVYEAKGVIYTPGVVNLGEVDQLNDILEDDLELSAALIPQNANVTFDVMAIRQSESGRDASHQVKAEVCVTADVEGHAISCSLRVMPDDELEPGQYEILIGIETNDIQLEQDIIRALFTKPTAVIRTDNEPLSLDSASPTAPHLRKTIEYEATLWEGDPKFVRDVEVIELRNVETQEELSTNNIAVKMSPVGRPESLRYELFVDTEALNTGNYELLIRPQSLHPNLRVEPEFLKLEFHKESAFATLELEGEAKLTVDESVWGILPLTKIPALFNGSIYHTVPLRTHYMNEVPALPDPVVVQIKERNGDETYSEDTFTFSWRNDGPIQDERDLYHTTLVGELIRDLPAGSYDIRLQMTEPILEPPETVVQLEVLGWTAFVWKRLVPSMIVLMVTTLVSAKANRIASHSFRGTLLVEGAALDLKGNQDLQLAIDENGLFCLRPDSPDSEVVIRCVNQEEIEIDFKDGGEPIRMKCGEALSENLAYFC